MCDTYVCMYVHTYVCTYVQCMHVQFCTCTTHVCMYSTYTPTYVCTYVRMYTLLSVRVIYLSTYAHIIGSWVYTTDPNPVHSDNLAHWTQPLGTRGLPARGEKERELTALVTSTISSWTSTSATASLVSSWRP